MSHSHTNDELHTLLHTTSLQATALERCNDIDLIGAIAAGDSAALEVLYDRYAAIVFRVAFRMLKHHELAEEIVQEVFWRVWRRSNSFEHGRGRVSQWLLGITHHLCIDELRRIQARPLQLSEQTNTPLIGRLIDERIDIAESACAGEQRRILQEAIGFLPQSQREAVELMYFGGLSHQEIATRLNRPLGTVKTRVRLGLQKLHGLLSARGLQPSDA